MYIGRKLWKSISQLLSWSQEFRGGTQSNFLSHKVAFYGTTLTQFGVARNVWIIGSLSGHFNSQKPWELRINHCAIIIEFISPLFKTFWWCQKLAMRNWLINKNVIKTLHEKKINEDLNWKWLSSGCLGDSDWKIFTIVGNFLARPVLTNQRPVFLSCDLSGLIRGQHLCGCGSSRALSSHAGTGCGGAPTNQNIILNRLQPQLGRRVGINRTCQTGV